MQCTFARKPVKEGGGRKEPKGIGHGQIIRKLQMEIIQLPEHLQTVYQIV